MNNAFKERGALLSFLFVIVLLAGCSSYNASPDGPHCPPTGCSTESAAGPPGKFPEPALDEKFPSLRLLGQCDAKARCVAQVSDDGRASVYPPDLNKGKSFWEGSREFDYVFAHSEPRERSVWNDLFKDVGVKAYKDLSQFKSREFLLTVGLGAVLAGASRSMDHDIADHLDDRHMIAGWEDAGAWLGHPAMHITFAGAMYFYSKMRNDRATAERGLILIEGLTLANITTGLLKVAFQRDRPNGDGLGFPSGHVASTFALASMLDEMYGHRVGYPMYLLGGFVAFARMSDDKHYLSDAVFGAFLGYAIGKAVFRGNELRPFGMDVEPYLNERTGAAGLALVLRF